MTRRSPPSRRADEWRSSAPTRRRRGMLGTTRLRRGGRWCRRDCHRRQRAHPLGVAPSRRRVVFPVRRRLILAGSHLALPFNSYIPWLGVTTLSTLIGLLRRIVSTVGHDDVYTQELSTGSWGRWSTSTSAEWLSGPFSIVSMRTTMSVICWNRLGRDPHGQSRPSLRFSKCVTSSQEIRHRPILREHSPHESRPFWEACVARLVLMPATRRPQYFPVVRVSVSLGQVRVGQPHVL